jgi:SNF2 family DNA or RNA helicase
LNGILTATLRAVSLRLTSRDKFNGHPVSEVTPAKEFRVSHELTPNQKAAQDIIKHIWDPRTRADMEMRRKTKGYQSHLSKKETFPRIMTARLSLVHEDCPTAGYGEAAGGEKDLADGPGGLLEQQIEDLMGSLDDHDGAVSGRLTKKFKKSMEKREAFRKKMEQGWSSPRILEVLKIIDQQKQKGKKGKYLMFSEFLCVLDVLHAALASRGYKVLRYDGWVPSAERETALRRFQDPTDDHEFMLVTSRSGGEGLNLQTATTVMHITPSWNSAMTRQNNARAVRNGQKSLVGIYNFVKMQSIEGHVYRLARDKDVKASALLDPTKDTLLVIDTLPEWSMDKFKAVVCALDRLFASSC